MDEHNGTETHARPADTASTSAPSPRACIDCGELTTGSIGAAGLHWKSLCQPCKDLHDGALLSACKAIAGVEVNLDTR